MIKKSLFLFLFFSWNIVNVLAQQINGLEYLQQKRPENNIKDTLNPSSWFAMLGGGYERVFGGENLSNHYGAARFELGIGRWMTPVSGVRLKVNTSLYPTYEYKEDINRLWRVGAEVNYLFRMSAIGQRKYSKWSTALTPGIGYYCLGHGNHRWNNISGHLGVLATYQLSPFSSIYIEPSVAFYGDELPEMASWRQYSVAPSVTMGVYYGNNKPNIAGVSPQLGKSKIEGFPNAYFFLGAGTELLVPNRPPLSLGVLGYNAKFGIGRFLTNTSGIRFTATLGATPAKIIDEYMANVRLGIDYTLSLNGLFAKGESARKFDLLLTPGVSAALSEESNRGNFAFGVGTGIQAIVPMSKETAFYIEPRISMMQPRFASHYSSSEFDLLGEVSAGLMVFRRDRTRRDAQVQKAIDNKLNFQPYWFISGKAGVDWFIRESLALKHRIEPGVSADLGYWFTPQSGVRAYGQTGLISYHTDFYEQKRSKRLQVGVDYLFNLNNAIGGYLPNRKLEFITGIGVSGHYRTSVENGISSCQVGVSTFVDANYNINDHWAITTGPRVTLLTKDWIPNAHTHIENDFIGSWGLGFTYKVKSYDREKSWKKFKNSEMDEYFISAGAGIGSMLTSSYKSLEKGVGATVMLGKWVTPLVGWRLGVRGELQTSIFSENQERYDVYGGIDADYMLNLSNWLAGVNPQRFFTISPVIGLSLGGVKSNSQMNFVAGLHAGVNGAFRINSSWSLFVEPKFALYGGKYENYSSRAYEPNLMAKMGLTYRFIHPEESSTTTEGMFATIASGVGIISNSFGYSPYKDNITFNYQIGIGKWFTPTSGMRVGFYQSYVNNNTQDQTHFDRRFWRIGADYLLNLNTLLGGATTRWNWITLAGVGIEHAELSADCSRSTASGNVGIQLNYQINDRISLYTEGKGVLHQDRLFTISKKRGIEFSTDFSLGTNISF